MAVIHSVFASVSDGYIVRGHDSSLEGKHFAPPLPSSHRYGFRVVVGLEGGRRRGDPC